MKNNIAINSQLNKWFTLQKSLGWRDDLICLKNIRNAFKAALKFGVWFQNAFNIISKSIYRSGRSVDSTALKQVWRSVLDKKQNKQVILLPPATLSPSNGISLHPPLHDQSPINCATPQLVSRMVVVDGTNVIFGSSSDHKPSILSLLCLVRELQKRRHVIKCYFDANTAHKLKDAGMESEAQVYHQLRQDYPNTFIEVPGGNRADDFLLAYAHGQGAPVISNDRFRDYWKQYPWLESDPERRISVLVHSDMMQIIQFSIQATLPTSLAIAMSLLRSGFWKPASARVGSRPMKRVMANYGGINRSMVTTA